MAVTNRWKSLRDTYRKQYKKYPQANDPTTGQKRKCPWKHFEPLRFLDGQFHAKKKQSSLPLLLNPDGLDSDNPKSSLDVVQVYHQSQCVQPDKHGQGSESVSKKKLSKRDCTTEQAEDTQFFRSLLPTVKSIPEDRKCLLRLKILEIVYNEVYNQSSGSSTVAVMPPAVVIVNSAGC